MTTHGASDADVIVVGAGPGGAASAYHLARRGLDVLLLEKTRFPREKVCGDGLTPRSVAALLRMGIDTTPEAGWIRNRGLRVMTTDYKLELDWPDLRHFPNYGLTRTRLDFDEMLARQAQHHGARMECGVNVTGPQFDLAGRVIGVNAKRDGKPVSYRAPVVIAADGVAGRFALSLGLKRDEKRPMGVAVRRYYHAPERTHDDYLESWLELRSAQNPDVLQPGYGWIFGLGDGRVNVGLGVLNSSTAYGKTNYRRLLNDWLETTDPHWGLNDESNAEGGIGGAALPMGFSRQPHYSRGVMLVGDSGGMVNPFNGEGIAYAMEAGEVAARISAQALRARSVPAREAILRTYPDVMSTRLGSYYRMGGIFVDLIGRPEIMRLCTERGLRHPRLMRLVLKLLANLADWPAKNTSDYIVNTLEVLTPRLSRRA
ncbi:geranylgeranyl reductase family protein [Haloglycomyces albus]|uniref:geranylgeranyl reductase family protein n=1 Tax=Haloglycomyces albus TaxID=526067 RepID=UPI00046CADDC|nr:geranylgeranyl reductase family protein [Haloglycomyces albus]